MKKKFTITKPIYHSIEAILIQIRTQLILGKGRVDFGKPSAYTLQEAQEAFNRVAVQHNWYVFNNLP